MIRKVLLGLMLLGLSAGCLAPSHPATQTPPATRAAPPDAQAMVVQMTVVPTQAPALMVPTARHMPPRRPVPTEASTPRPTRTPRANQVVWRGDLHMHTNCSDGSNSYDEMVQAARDQGLDFIAITDHGAPEAYAVKTVTVGDHSLACTEVYQRCEREDRLLCIPGSEVTGRLHLLAIGISTSISTDQPLADQVADIHSQGGIAIAAHPYDKRWKYTRNELLFSGFDAMECARGTPEENQQQWLLSDKYHIPCVYNSDSHYRQDVGWRYNVCSVPINSLADLKSAIAGGKCKENGK